MSELIDRRPSGLSRQALRTWGMLALALGAGGMALIQNGILGAANTSGVGLLQLMESTPAMMGFATLALVLQVVYCCATPIFAFLLTEGFAKTADRRMYFLRVLGLALISELPYNLAFCGKWIAMESRNPVFGLIIAMAMLWLFCRYPGRSFKAIAVKLAVAAAALIWTWMLGIAEGPSLVLLAAVLWLLRGKERLRVLFGCVTAFVCCLFSLFYIAAPMAFLAIHFYNGEKGEGNRFVNYLSYPVILLITGVLGTYLI